MERFKRVRKKVVTNKVHQVTFFQVSRNQTKQHQIVNLAHKHFYNKEPLLFKLPNQSALDYLDGLLWRMPLDSFLPHAIRNTPCDDLIALTSSENNPNRARGIFNLTHTPITDSSFQMIYTFENLGSSRRNSTAQSHYQVYKSLGYNIILSRVQD